MKGSEQSRSNFLYNKHDLVINLYTSADADSDADADTNADANTQGSTIALIIL